MKYTEERRDPIIWINDLERGIVGWDMGLLVGLVRSALGSGYITKEEAWRYIEQANTLCADVLHTPEEIDKSFLIGKAMKSEKIEDWDRFCLVIPDWINIESNHFRGPPRNSDRPGELYIHPNPAKRPIILELSLYTNSWFELHIRYLRFL